MNNQKYQCCFCGENIQSNQIDVTGLTGLIVVSNWDKSQELQQEQQLFCHMECLRDKLAKDVPLYIADIFE